MPYSADTANYYQYYLTDHLGNTRVAFDSPTGQGLTVEQLDDYLPFGLDVESIANYPANEYLYNKKELQQFTGLYDYGARFYDPVTARFTTVDPLAEKDRKWSPYSYGFDNSISFEDPDGMWPDWGALLTQAYNNFKREVRDIDGAIRSGGQAANSLANNFNKGTVALVTAIVNAPGNYQIAATSKNPAARKEAKKEFKKDAATIVVAVATEGAGKVVGPLFEGVAPEVKLTEESGELSKVGELPEPGKGKGSVSPIDRDPKRTWTKDERAEMLENQEGKCARCGAPKSLDEVQAHHKVRHADGGPTNGTNGAALCKECHIQIHQ